MSCAFVASASAAMVAAESLCMAATGQVLLVRSAGRNSEIQVAATPFPTRAPREPAGRSRDFVETGHNPPTAPLPHRALCAGGCSPFCLDAAARLRGPVLV